MKLTLIRHGITEGNRRRLYYGRSDIPLADEGRAELAEKKKTGGYPTGQRYYTSGMHRTEETFAILYGDTPHTALPGLREMNFGVFEMRSYEELKDDSAFQTWISGNILENVCPDGESFLLLQRRVVAAIEPVLRAGEDAVCVIHGGVIAALMNTWFPAKQDYYAYTPQPGNGYQIIFTDGAPKSYRPIP